MKILVIAPHPDDEVLGCGGTIAKASDNGDDVYLCIVTKAYTPDWSEEFIKNRPKEVKKSNQILGIKKTYFLDYPTVKLDTIPQKELNGSLVKIVNEIKPDIVYIPHKGDLNKDHKLVFSSAMVALRPVNSPQLKAIYAYETLSETEWNIPSVDNLFVPNVWVDITNTIDTKIEAMKCYQSQLYDFPHTRSLEAIEVLSKFRGSTICVNNAESFMLIRSIH